MFKPSLDQCVAEARASKGPRPFAIASDDRLTRLAELERTYDGPIPEQLLRASPSAAEQLRYPRSLIFDQIKAIRCLETVNYLSPQDYGTWMARLYRDLRVYIRDYRTLQASLRAPVVADVQRRAAA